MATPEQLELFYTAVQRELVSYLGRPLHPLDRQTCDRCVEYVTATYNHINLLTDPVYLHLRNQLREGQAIGAGTAAEIGWNLTWTSNLLLHVPLFKFGPRQVPVIRLV